MTSTPTGVESVAWVDLVHLALDGRRGQRLLGKLSEEFLRRSGLQSAAVYLLEDGTLQRRLQMGDEIYPRALGEEPVARTGRYDLAGCTVLFEPAEVATDSLDHQVLLTVLCALRAAELGGRLKRESFTVNLRGVQLQSLYDVGLAIAGTLDLEKLGDEVLLRAVSLLDARVGAFYLFDGARYRLDKTFGGEARDRVDPDDPALVPPAAGESVGAPLLPGTEFVSVAPIEADGRSLGLLVVADKESRTGVGPFLPADEQTLKLFANQAAIAIENAHLHREALEKERLERELDLAADIQRGLLPTEVPIVPGFELAGWSRPARHVGGDHYDMAVEDGSIQLVLADVSGKGMPAALLVSTLHSALRLLLTARAFDAELVERLNRHIAESSASNKFITMTVAKLDPESGRLTYVNAGHNPPLVVRADGTLEELPPGGMPLGMFAAAQYRAAEVDLAAGDLLCIFSDGITECENPAAEEFGPDRLAELLRELANEPLTEVIAAIDRAVVDFAAGGPQGDDQTVVVVRRAPVSS